MDHLHPHSNGSGPGTGDPKRVMFAAEALTNLLFLASRDVEDPERVRMYLKLAEERLHTITEVLRKNLP
jgi:hypothetical protein